MTTESLIVGAPLFITLGTALAVLIADLFSRRAALVVGLIGLAAACGAGLYCVYGLSDLAFIEGVMVGGLGYSASSVVVTTLAALALLGGWHWYQDSPGGGPAIVLVLMVTAASIALSMTVDVVLLLIVLEVLAVSGYALVTQAGTSRAGEAGVKYVIQGSVATGLLVLGLAVLLGLHGSTTSIVLIAENLTREYASQTMLVIGLFVAAYAYKLGAFPFHSWAPDAFETAPPASGAALASVPKLAAIISFFIVIFSSFGRTFTTLSADGYIDISVVLGVLAAASIIYGNLGALRQSSYTRMLGYSGIAQVGYALVGAAVLVGQTGPEAAASNRALVMPATAVLVASYGVAVVGAFLIAEWVFRRLPSWDRSIAQMAGLGRTTPVLGVAAAIIMFSMTGIPLTVGFWGKLYVFGAAVEVDWVWLAIIGVLGSVVSFGYYGNILKVMFFDEPEEGTVESAGRGRAPLAAVLISAAIIIVLGILPLVTGVGPLFRFFAF